MLDRISSQSGDPRTTVGGSKTQTISEQIELLKTDLSGLAQTVTGLAKEQIGEKAGEVQAVAGEKAGELQAAIRSNPMQSAAVAAGIGFVIGLLMTR
jgi:ElaB/YqjD/DUF883 family membrane-anchored ribosome-binding protein